MILLIDIGNSCIKWTILHGGEVLPSSRSCYTVREMSWEWLDKVVTKPDAIYVISVGREEVVHRLAEACCERWDLTPVTLDAAIHCGGLMNGYDCPLTLGVDRWAAMVGAFQLKRDAVLVIDCGTACSADVVDAEGRHLGGAIIPGLHLMQQGLMAGTARINATSDKGQRTMLGRTTTGCIQFGVTTAILGFIERMERHAAILTGGRCTVFITGGDASALLPLLQNHIRYEKELVFLGMAGMVREIGE